MQKENLTMRKKLSVKSLFFISHTALAFVCILTFSLFFYSYVSDILMERQTSSLLTLTDNFQTNTDATLSTMEEVSLNYEYSQQVSPTSFPFTTNATSALDMLNTLKNSFLLANGIQYDVIQMNAYDLQGLKLSVGTYTYSAQMNLDELTWIDETLYNRGLKYIGAPYTTSLIPGILNSSTSYISIYHALYDSYGRHVGYVESVQTSKKVFLSIISYVNSDKSNTQIYVFNKEGDLMYPYTNLSEEIIDSCDFYFTATITAAENYLSVENPLTNDKELMTFSTSSYSEFTYITIQSESVILAPITTFTKILFLLILVILLFVFLASYIVSRNLTRPIYKLLAIFHSTKIDTLGTKEQFNTDTSFNEFDQLNDAFNNMSSQLKDSMNVLLETQQQELKSRSLALQSQINPHFYYNSLSSIMVLAEDNKTSEIMHFAKNLTSMMRYITTGSMQIVTLGSEISYVEKYLYCMKIRHQNSLTYSIKIDSSLLDISIPKLLIQPLIENAVKYGMDCNPPWSIHIYSEITESQWFIHVSDSGHGFTEDALTQLSQRIKDADSSIGLPEMHIDGMGLLNVYLRWRLYNKENVFYFGNSPDGGGLLTIGGNRYGES